MKLLFQSVSILLVFLVLFSMKPFKKTKVVFFGDSITQMGMNPGGFILRMKEMLTAKELSSQYELIDEGVGYDKVYDLYFRMDSDVLAKDPDVVFIWVGVNDVGHKMTGTGTDPDKFLKFYDAIIKTIQKRNIKLILVTPAVIGERTDETNRMDGDLNYYAKMVRDLAVKYHCGLIEMRKEYQAYNLQHNPENKDKGILTVDGIHPTDAGNKLIAKEMMKKLIPNVNWDIYQFKN